MRTAETTEPRTKPEFRQVYFIEAEGLGVVKIGSAGHVQSRMASLQTGCPVKLRVRGTFTTDDANTMESNLHRDFAHLRLHGEWFKLEGELIDLSLGCGGPDDPIAPKIIVFPERHAPSNPDATIHWKADDTQESFVHRVALIAHALHPELYEHPDAEPEAEAA